MGRAASPYRATGRTGLTGAGYAGGRGARNSGVRGIEVPGTMIDSDHDRHAYWARWVMIDWARCLMIDNGMIMYRIHRP